MSGHDRKTLSLSVALILEAPSSGALHQLARVVGEPPHDRQRCLSVVRDAFPNGIIAIGRQQLEQMSTELSLVGNTPR